MRKTKNFFSWAMTSVVTAISAFGIVALTAGNAATTSAVAKAAPTSVVANTAALSTSTVPAVSPTSAHVVTYTVRHDDGN